MKHVVYVLLVLLGFAACKPSEENYRQAYERTMARDSVRTEFNETVYGRYRREARQLESRDDNGDTASVTVMRVSVTPDGGAIREHLKKYNVVVAGFKQLLNAQSMRQRMQDGGYPGAFVVQTAEPYYYVVAGSFADVPAARALRDRLSAKSPVTLRAPYPYLLVPTYLQ